MASSTFQVLVALAVAVHQMLNISRDENVGSIPGRVGWSTWRSSKL